MASRLQGFALAVLVLALAGCAPKPGGAKEGSQSLPPPAPSAELLAVRETLRSLGRGMRSRERRVEETRESLQRLSDAFERAREESAQAGKSSRDALGKAGEAIEGLAGRIENLERQLGLLVERASRADAREKERRVSPAGLPSRASPVGAPLAGARVPSVGLPGSGGAQTAGLPADAVRVTVAPPPSADPPRASGPGPADDYARAVRVLREERSFAKARGLLEAFIAGHPTHELADDAQYWIGQSYFQEKNFEGAILAFNKVQVDYANGDKAPEALLLEALSFLSLGDQASARELLGRVIGKYPDSAAAGEARERLESL